MPLPTPLHVSILALEYGSITDTIGVADTLYKSGMLYHYFFGTGQKSGFKIELALLNKNDSFQPISTLFNCRSITEIKKTDIIIVPAVYGNMEKCIRMNMAYAMWLAEQHKRGAWIGSISTGSFLVAAAGLIKGEPAFTHYLYKPDFMRLFPGTVIRDHSFSLNKKRISYSNSFINLSLFFIEKFYGKEIALQSSRLLLNPVENILRSRTVLAPNIHADKRIIRAQEYIEEHVKKNLTIKAIAGKVHMGERNFTRKFKIVTGYTPKEYILVTKFEYVKHNLENGNEDIQQVIYDIGYENVDSFRKLFKKHTGISPAIYRKKIRGLSTNVPA
jgi:transcriptional regulator GlxA family with amidase domain